MLGGRKGEKEGGMDGWREVGKEGEVVLAGKDSYQCFISWCSESSRCRNMIRRGKGHICEKAEK